MMMKAMMTGRKRPLRAMSGMQIPSLTMVADSMILQLD